MAMKPKNYQLKVLEDLSKYLDAVDGVPGLSASWQAYWNEQGARIGYGENCEPPYNDRIKGTPHVCMKVPTGGGKTFMACASLRTIFEHTPNGKPKVVIWLVPSDSILKQTIRTLSDAEHGYRQRLDSDFAGRVGIYSKDALLSAQNFSPDTIREMLTVCVLSYASLRIDSKAKDIRKVYQENGNLFRFAEYLNDKNVLLADTPETALIQVLRSLSPIVIVDESHNAGSDLSTEMLENLNPSFILELTATPRKASNIISYVDARKLKAEHMVKLPVIVFNRHDRQSVILDAIQLRGSLEKQANEAMAAGGRYVRPIVLFQAQPKISEDSDTFEKIRDVLLDLGIKREQIAIKTSKVDDIGSADLLSPDCEIRYIITVNALKEGWDCPFAYVLASLANKTSKVDVEQILGRILRAPHAREQKGKLLNASYVLTCSNDFRSTLESIVAGLNNSGFTRKDYRAPSAELESSLLPADEIQNVEQTSFNPEDLLPRDEGKEDFSDFDTETMRQELAALQTDGEEVKTGEETPKPKNRFEEMMDSAEKQAENYEREIKAAEADDALGGEWDGMTNRIAIQKQYREKVKDLLIPQFFYESEPDLFGETRELLEPENLSEGFSLTKLDARVNFELSTGEAYKVDVQAEGEAVPKYKRLSSAENENVKKYLESLPPEARVRQCADMIAKQINKNNRYSSSDVNGYVNRIIANMTNEELAVMETSIPSYAKKIQEKIDALEGEYRRELFAKWIDGGKISCKASYALPQFINPAETIDSIPLSLYEGEKDNMNDFERRVIDVVAGMDNVEWWHRIIDRKGFRINGYINHYPDFMVCTKSGKIVLIEAKGDWLDGDDSRERLDVGRNWQELVGRNYRYFMVFENKEFGLKGAYTLDNFVEIFKNL